MCAPSCDIERAPAQAGAEGRCGLAGSRNSQGRVVTVFRCAQQVCGWRQTTNSAPCTPGSPERMCIGSARRAERIASPRRPGSSHTSGGGEQLLADRARHGVRLEDAFASNGVCSGSAELCAVQALLRYIVALPLCAARAHPGREAAAALCSRGGWCRGLLAACLGVMVWGHCQPAVCHLKRMCDGLRASLLPGSRCLCVQPRLLLIARFCSQKRSPDGLCLPLT
ncbi:hypothetical protein NDU88_007195 [Pleurodeles waltl]|uniref:Uncharacterized protein n=1 Tax=Pleurodeles waltl TaxID=8319 RepID=A0AAV7NU57_PLEWA|nr:hypothetical protein NDU88_007195 [Pleurodeles waltl]